MRKALARSFAAIAVLLLAVFAAPAHAATGALAVRSLDTTAFPNVNMTVQYTGATAPNLQDFVVRENGQIVNGVVVRPLAETVVPVGVVLVIDTSGSMKEQGRLEAARAAATAFVDGRGPNEQIAVVAFSNAPQVIHNFSSDGSANAAIANLRPSGETALWDAVRLAAGLFADRPDLQGNIVVLSDGRDSASSSSAGDARNAAVAAHAVVHTIGFASSALDAQGLTSLAHATGGRDVVTTTATGVGQLFEQIRRTLNEQFQLTWHSAGAETLELSVSVRDATTTARGAPGAISRERGTRPEEVTEPSRWAHIGQYVGRPFAVLGAILCAIVVVIGIGNHIRSPRSLAARLRAYESDGVPLVLNRTRGVSLATSSMTQNAVAGAASAMKGKGVLEWVERKLDQARLPVRADEAAFFAVAFAVIAAGFAFVAVGPMQAFAAFFFGLALPAITVAVMGALRKRKFVKQLPEMLQLLASSLRAGYALLQGCEAVAREISDPMGAELRRVLAEARLGRPLEEALEESARRMESADYSWVVMAISIQRSVGGNLAELLDTVAETMVARTRLKREVKALTAEGRVSALMLGIMPPALAAAMVVLSPGYLDPLFQERMGQFMLGGGIVLLIGGFMWMQKMIKVDI